jgi:hypothetical protein
MRVALLVRPVAAIAVVASALSLGCGGSESSTSPSDTEGRPAADGAASESVSVLGSRVAVDAQRVTLGLRLRQPAGIDPPIARTMTVTLLGDIAYRGGAQPACDVATIQRDGAEACPPKSVIGKGVAVGSADTAEARATITLLNGGPGTVLLATVVRNPAYVKRVVPGTIVKDDRGGLKIDFTLPENLQNVGGVPVGLQRLDLALDRGGAVVIGPCPSGGARWRYAATVAFADDSVARHAGAATCTG